jgi:superoxide dismutase, Fe-Mn family
VPARTSPINSKTGTARAKRQGRRSGVYTIAFRLESDEDTLLASCAASSAAAYRASNRAALLRGLRSDRARDCQIANRQLREMPPRSLEVATQGNWAVMVDSTPERTMPPPEGARSPRKAPGDLVGGVGKAVNLGGKVASGGQSLNGSLLGASACLHGPASGTLQEAYPHTQAQRSIAVTFKLPELPYAYDALSPYMSKETLEFHHDKHHQAYVDNGNKVAGPGTKYDGKSIEDICREAFAAKDAPVINNIGQHYNHIHFWQWMKKGGGGKKLPGKLQTMVDKDLGGFDKMRSDFVQAGVSQFGSGWAWLAVKNGKLEVTKTPNGENPLMHAASPILGVDVWEHSYYIDYRNARPKYLEAFFDNLVNWEHVEAMLDKAK